MLGRKSFLPIFVSDRLHGLSASFRCPFPTPEVSAAEAQTTGKKSKEGRWP